jgi:hypothetical protein
MNGSRDWTSNERRAAVQAPGQHREGPEPRAIRALLSVLALLGLAGLLAERANQVRQDGRSDSGLPSAAERVVLLESPVPEVAPPLEVARVAPASPAGWFAARDRAGRLVALDAVAGLDAVDARSRAAARAASSATWTERVLPNGAVEIELPEDLAGALYGWLDDDGVLHTGHAPPAATTSRSEKLGEGGGR